MGVGRRMRRVLAIAVMLAVAGPQAEARRHRAEEPAKPTARAEKPFPFDVTWVLSRLNDKPLVSGDPPSFAIDQTLRGRGFAGCNTFSVALYPVRDQHLASGAIAMTRKVCAADAMALERTFLVALHSGPKWSVLPVGDLTLTAGQTVMVFHRGI